MRSGAKRAAARAAGAAVLSWVGLLATIGGAAAADAKGEVVAPRPWEIAMQPAATPVKQHLMAFDTELLIIIFAISVFVLGLLLYVIIRFNHKRNPVPSHTEHNTVIEILWTVVPVLILVIIAVPSFKLLYYEMDVPKGTKMTVKITGHQWYWSYAYPTEGGLSFNSNIVPTKDLKPGQPRLLTVNNPLVVPVGTNIRILVTSTDVIHSWFVPSFGVQEYAMPGQDNEAWFRVLHVGTYYGECNQICGYNHAFMPIEIRAVSKPDFDKWLVKAKKEFAQDGRDSAAPKLAARATPAAD